MKHPEIFLLPVFMLADYFLTIYSAVLLDRRYRDFFKINQYELNPLWQKAVASKAWFNPKHLGITALATAYFVLLFETGLLSASTIQGFIGCVFIIYAIVIQRHITNILLAQWIIQNPDDFSGSVTMSHRYSLYASLFQGVGTLLLIILLVIFSPTPFIVGSLIGAGLFVFIHFIWIARHKHALAKRKQAEEAQAESVGSKE